MDAMSIIILILSIIAIIISVVSLIKMHKLPGKINKDSNKTSDPKPESKTVSKSETNPWGDIKIVPGEVLSLIMLGKNKWFIIKKKLPEDSFIKFVNGKYVAADTDDGKIEYVYEINPYSWFLEWLDSNYVIYKPSWKSRMTEKNNEVVWKNALEDEETKKNGEKYIKMANEDLTKFNEIIKTNFGSLDMKNHLLIGDLYNPVFTTNPIEVGPTH